MATIYRYIVETIVKQLPPYLPYDPANGRWRPFVRQPIEEECDKEPKPETMNLNLWDKVRGRKQRRTLPGFLVSQKARSFYRAVAGRAASCSEREAKRFDISVPEFRKHIRDPLLARKMATWKDEKHHNLGVNLTADALRTMELLGRER